MHYRRGFLSGFLLLIMLLCFGFDSTARAQASATTSRIMGTVHNEQNVPISGVTITAESAVVNVSRSAKSGQDGTFSLSELPPSVYKLKVAGEGFNWANPMDLSLGVIKQVDVIVKGFDGDAKVSIKVSNLANAGASFASIDRVRKAVLPLNLFNFLDLSYTTPRITLDRLRFSNGGATTSKLSVDGQSARFISINVNGFDIVDKAPGGTRPIYPFGAIQEMNVLTDSYSAEFGRSLGGVINAVTKSGNNEFHGGAAVALIN